MGSFSLFYQDSNLDKQDQNLLCYHYTIEQCCTLYNHNFLVCAAKVDIFAESPNKNPIFLHFFFSRPLFYFKSTEKDASFHDNKLILTHETD